MKPNNLGYLFKQGAKNLFANKLMSFACIGVLVACLLLIGSAMLLTATVNNLATDLEQQNEVAVYLEETVTRADLETLDGVLGSMDNILEIHFISKEEALGRFQEESPDYEALFEGLEGDENPLAHTYMLRIKEPARMQETVAALLEIRGVEKVYANVELANMLSTIRGTVYYAGSGVVLILLIVSIAIIANTIRLTIFSRRREINIMKYVGATDGFIHFPFLVEGVLIGLIAAIIAFLLLGFGYTYLLNWARSNYDGFLALLLAQAVNFRDLAGYFLVGFTGIGVFIGTVGSTMFVRKYLKV
jgi:Cell division protein